MEELAARVAVLERALIATMRAVQESDPLMGEYMLGAMGGIANGAQNAAEEKAHAVLIKRVVEAKIG